MRLRNMRNNVPKPMVPIGYRACSVARYEVLRAYGHKDFILCLGHRADVIKQYFCIMMSASPMIFRFRKAAKTATVQQRHPDWNITFAETGTHSISASASGR